MLRHAIVLVEQVVEGATLAGVVALRSQICLETFLTAENQHSSPFGLHDRQGVERNHLINLGCPSICDREAAGVQFRVFDGTKGRVADDHIDLIARSKS